LTVYTQHWADFLVEKLIDPETYGHFAESTCEGTAAIPTLGGWSSRLEQLKTPAVE